MLSRRTLIAGSASALATAAAHLPVFAQSSEVFAPKPGAWRSYEVKTTVVIPDARGVTQAWIPLPAFSDDSWIKPGKLSFTTATGKAGRVRDPGSGAEMLHVVWPATVTAPEIEVVNHFAARDRRVDPARLTGEMLSAAERARYTAATELQPTDGIVRDTALRITAGAGTDLEKARRLYAWIVDNTLRDPKTRGCGTGDIASMLRTGNLGGKCADLNALFVGLARAVGLPARDLYGIRVAPSQFGYKSLGANSPTITKAQHCRAEVFIANIGWLPADPADVRKVILEEPPGNLAAHDIKVAAARAALFGAWESNWLAYNAAHDVELPGSKGPRLAFLMYPQAETAAGRLDCLDPDSFRYSITARAIPA